MQSLRADMDLAVEVRVYVRGCNCVPLCLIFNATQCIIDTSHPMRLLKQDVRCVCVCLCVCFPPPFFASNVFFSFLVLKCLHFMCAGSGYLQHHSAMLLQGVATMSAVCVSERVSEGLSE